MHRNPPLKLVITSATLEGEKFSAHFFNAPVLHVPGRCFEVQLIHATEDHERDYLDAAVNTALHIHTTQPPGAGCCGPFHDAISFFLSLSLYIHI